MPVPATLVPLFQMVNVDHLRDHPESIAGLDDAESAITDQEALLEMLDEHVSEGSTASSSEASSAPDESDNPFESDEVLEVAESESEEVPSGIEEPDEDPIPPPKVEKKKEVRQTLKPESHSKTLAEIDQIAGDLSLINLEGSFDRERAAADPGYAQETYDQLLSTYEDNTFAMGIRELIIYLAGVVPVIFDGKREILGRRMPDMFGYDTAVKSKIVTVKRETLMMAKTIRLKIGENVGAIFNLIRLFVFPAWTTWKKNTLEDSSSPAVTKADMSVFDR